MSLMTDLLPAWVVSGIFTICGMALLPMDGRAEQPELCTGSALSATLARRVGLEISGDSRRDALQVISKQFGIALFLDRRIDPDAPLNYRTKDTILGKALSQIAAKCDAAITWLGPIGYVGPADQVNRLQTVRAVAQQQIRSIPSNTARRLLQSHSLGWERLATPAEILSDVTGKYQLQWMDSARIPHDLWPAGRLPPTDCATQCIIILAGFDAMPRFDQHGRFFGIEPIDSDVAFRKSYPVAPDAQDEMLRKWKQLSPYAVVQRDGARLVVSGRAEDHWQLNPETKPDDMPNQEMVDDTPAGARVYTLRVEAPIEAILTAVARQTGLTLRWKRKAIADAGINLQRVVQLDVKEAALETLVDQLLTPHGLSSRRSGTELIVAPTEK